MGCCCSDEFVGVGSSFDCGYSCVWKAPLLCSTFRFLWPWFTLTSVTAPIVRFEPNCSCYRCCRAADVEWCWTVGFLTGGAVCFGVVG